METHRHRNLLRGVVLVAGLLLWAGPVFAGVGTAERVILDTDIGNDVDDLGALAVLHALADRGEVEILAIVISNGHANAVPFTRLVNRHFGRPDIPLGIVKGRAPVDWDHYMEAVLADQPSAGDNASAPDATRLYRQVLAAQPDASVVLVTVGPATNIARLLRSGPDEISPLAGTELVRRKVKFYAAGGNGSGTLPHGRCGFNYRRDQPAARIELAEMPREIPMVFAGGSGEVIKVGGFLATRPENDLLRRCYRTYLKEAATLDRPTWDQLRVLYASRAASRASFATSPPGQITLDQEGLLEWQAEGGGNQAYAYVSDEAAVREQIESLMKASGNGSVRPSKG